VTRFAVDRRRFLRSLGMAIPAVALPVLRSSPLLAATPPVRFALFFQANGTILDAFWPSTTGTSWTIPAGSILESLAPWKAKLNILHGVHYKAGEAGPGSGHQKGPLCCLTGGHGLRGGMGGGGNSAPAGFADRISMDQYVASKWGPVTRLRTLEAGVRVQGTGDRHAISYLGSNQPVFPENDPAKLYARVFGNLVVPGASGNAPEPKVLELLGERQSVIDYARGEVGRLIARLPGDERVRLQRHLDSLRDLERQLAPTMAAAGVGCAPAAPPALDPLAVDSYPMVTKLQMDIMFMAFTCDQTRLGHLIWNGETSQQTFPWLQVNDPHHTMSHASDGSAAHDKLIKVNRWYAEQFAYFVGKMDGVKEANGKTMLDNSLAIWTNGMGKGNTHTRDNIPWVLAGSAGGYFRTGRSLQYNHPHNDLLVSIMNALGLKDEKTFGDPAFCTGPLPDLV
jgi:hypothetical protein